MSHARFITVEGIEGAGKSTCLALVQAQMAAFGHPPLVTREPGGTPLGESLRALLLSHKHDGMADDTELLLMFAARAEHLRNKIEPALAAGTWVLCDRFTDATFAYQGGGRGLPMSRIAALQDWVQGDMRPDFTLLLDLPVEVGLARAGKRSAPDRFEKNDLDFFTRVRQTYLDIAAREPQRVHVIDASKPLPEVQAQIRQVMADYLHGST